jgi:hypothetical protein
LGGAAEPLTTLKGTHTGAKRGARHLVHGLERRRNNVGERLKGPGEHTLAEALQLVPERRAVCDLLKLFVRKGFEIVRGRRSGALGDGLKLFVGHLL